MVFIDIIFFLVFFTSLGNTIDFKSVVDQQPNSLPITFNNSSETVTLNSNLTVAKHLEIINQDNNGSMDFIFDNGQIFVSGQQISFCNFRFIIAENNSFDYGFVLEKTANLTIINSSFLINKATQQFLFAKAGSFFNFLNSTIASLNFSSNNTQITGLLIFLENCSALIENCVFQNNSFREISLIYSNESKIVFKKTHFRQNYFLTTPAIYGLSGVFTYFQGDFSENFYSSSFLSYENCLVCQSNELFLIQFSRINSNINTGDSFIKINYNVVSAKVANFSLENCFFKKEKFTTSIISANYLKDFSVFNVNLNYVTSAKAILLNDVDSTSFYRFSCMHNIGNCMELSTYITFIFNNSQIFNCASESFTPGLLLQDSDEKLGKSIIDNALFKKNIFSSGSTEITYLGCALYFFNVNSLLIQNSLFEDNFADLKNNFYGGPALVFFKKSGKVFISNSYFQDCRSKKNSLTFEFIGYNFTVINSNFLGNHQSEYSKSDYTATIMQGNANYLIMENCILTANFASHGLIFMTDPEFTIFLMNKVHVFHNTGDLTSGVYICTETTNKTILWQNSIIFDSMNKTLTNVLYLYIPNVIDKFDLRYVNVTISHNKASQLINPSITKKTEYVAILWGYTKNIYLEFTNCSFDSNSNINPFFSVYGIEKYLIIRLLNTSFINNYCSFIIISDHALIEFNNVVFIRNNFFMGHVMYSSATEAFFTNIHFYNSSFLDYEIFLFSDYSNGVFTNITYEDVYTNSEVFNLINMNSTLIENIQMNRLKAIDFLISANSSIDSIKNVSIYDSEFLNTVFYFKSSAVNILASFYSKLNVFAVFLYILDRSAITLEKVYGVSSVKNDIPSNLFLSLQTSQLTLKDCYWNFGFVQLQTEQLNLRSSSLTLKNSAFFGFSGNTTNIFLMYIYKSTAIFEGVVLKNCSQYFIAEGAMIHIFESRFFYSNVLEVTSKNIKNLFVLINIAQLNITHSNFSHMSSLSSVFLIQDSLDCDFMILNQSIFSELHSKNDNGGAISVENSKINITNCVFTRNSAYQGGGIYLFCSFENIDLCNFALVKNKFIKNSAQIAGGALKWKYAKPKEVENVYLKNSAEHSVDYSSYFCKVGFDVVETDEKNKTVTLFSSYNVNSSGLLTLRNVTSNQAIKQVLKLYPMDTYNQIVYESITERMDLSILPKKTGLVDAKCLDNSTKLLGKTSQFLDVKTQTYVFDYIIINSCPNVTVYLNISSDIGGLPLNLYEKPNSLNENFTNYIYSLIFPIEIRQCLPGEIFNKITNECEPCVENYYSFSTNDKECALCPLAATCPGGSFVILEPNYWRSSINSSLLYRCDENLENCLGGYLSLCKEDYEGVLCINCKGNLKKNFIGECKECPSEFINLVANFFFFIFVMIFLGFLLQYFMKKVIDEKKKFICINFIHYIHFLFLSQKFNTNALKSSLELYITFRSSMWFSLDCFLLMMTKNTDFYINNFLKSLYLYFGFLLYIIMYIFLNRKEKYKKLLEALFSFYYCSFPFFLCFFFENLACIEVDGNNFLRQNTSVDCSSSSHINWAYGYFLPNILLFVLFLPLLLLLKYFKFVFGFREFALIFDKKFLIAKIREFFSVIKHEEFSRFVEKLLLIFVRYSGLENEDENLVNFLILLAFFLLALKFENHPLASFLNLGKFILLIFLLNCYFFVVLDNFFENSVALFFIVVSVIMKLLFYYFTFTRIFFSRFSQRKIFPEKFYKQRNKKTAKKTDDKKPKVIAIKLVKMRI